jgi:hypothetical protein
VNAGIDFRRVDEITDHAELRWLDKQDALAAFGLYLAETSAEMRGIDFRVKLHAICLIIAKPFESERDAN